jgi:hypothetical protein
MAIFFKNGVMFALRWALQIMDVVRSSIMKALLILLSGMLMANLALANSPVDHTVNVDGIATVILLAIGIVCLIIARRRSA